MAGDQIYAPLRREMSPFPMLGVAPEGGYVGSVSPFPALTSAYRQEPAPIALSPVRAALSSEDALVQEIVATVRAHDAARQKSLHVAFGSGATRVSDPYSLTTADVGARLEVSATREGGLAVRHAIMMARAKLDGDYRVRENTAAASDATGDTWPDVWRERDDADLLPESKLEGAERIDTSFRFRG